MAGDDVVFSVRRAQVEDAPVIAWHRARMFQDMGALPAATFDGLVSEARLWTERALEILRWARAEQLDRLVLHAST